MFKKYTNIKTQSHFTLQFSCYSVKLIRKQPTFNYLLSCINLITSIINYLYM